MKNTLVITLILLGCITVLSAQLPVIEKSGACRGYDIIVNSVTYEGFNDFPCWDTNQNGFVDPSEDTNMDGVVNVLDCAGGPGCWDLNGNGIGDPAEDINADGVFNIHDCTDCWDTNFNDIEDPDEDTNGDGLYDTNDCQQINVSCISTSPVDPLIGNSNNLELSPNGVGPDGLNGLDIVNIIKWLVIGFPGPLEAITSDFDGNGTVSTQDVIDLQKYILGIDQFPTYRKFNAVLEGHTFPAVDPFDQDVDYSSLTFSDADVVDDTLRIFVYNLGDTDQSALFKGEELEPRSRNSLSFEDVFLSENEVQSIEFSLVSDKGILGSIFRLKSDELEFIAVEDEGNAADMIYNNQANRLSMSYATYTSQDTVSFTLEILPSESGYLSDMISLDNTFLKEIVSADYNLEDLVLNPMASSLSTIMDGEIRVYPNPAEDNLTIQFEENDARHISMISASGQLVQDIHTSESEVVFSFNQNIVPGLYLLKIEHKSSTSTKQIVIR